MHADQIYPAILHTPFAVLPIHEQVVTRRNLNPSSLFVNHACITCYLCIVYLRVS